MVLYVSATFALSGEPGAYDFTGSLTAFGTLKNPFNMVLNFSFAQFGQSPRVKIRQFCVLIYWFFVNEYKNTKYILNYSFYIKLCSFSFSLNIKENE